MSKADKGHAISHTSEEAINMREVRIRERGGMWKQVENELIESGCVPRWKRFARPTTGVPSTKVQTVAKGADLNAPAEYHSNSTSNHADHSPQQHFGCTALRRCGEVPDCTESVTLKPTVDHQAHTARPNSVDGYVKELHAHGVENLEGEQRS